MGTLTVRIEVAGFQKVSNQIPDEARTAIVFNRRSPNKSALVRLATVLDGPNPAAASPTPRRSWRLPSLHVTRTLLRRSLRRQRAPAHRNARKPEGGSMPGAKLSRQFDSPSQWQHNVGSGNQFALDDSGAVVQRRTLLEYRQQSLGQCPGTKQSGSPG